MKTSPAIRVLAILGALLVSATGMTPYEVAFAVRATYSAVQANSPSWVLALRNATVPSRS